jgi:hypothetical protein
LLFIRGFQRTQNASRRQIVNPIVIALVLVFVLEKTVEFEDEDENEDDYDLDKEKAPKITSGLEGKELRLICDDGE